ncbi:MAG: cell elongation specific D,D-transpeptidase [Candidatus Acidoferrum typicum]|nr:cell elongation specific D,D-transpeptidase [Candidatus Acidoferrum typicum]
MEILARGVFVSYWFRNDNRLPQGRLAVASYIIVGMIGVLLLGFWKLQVIDADKYSSMAERNRVRYIPVIAPRGRMLDRDGRVLVDNRPAFSVLLLRDEPTLVEKYLPSISDGLGIPLDDLRDQLANTKNLPKFQPIIIKPDASRADIDFIESHRSDIPVLEMISVSRRRYLPGGFLAHAAGYVGEVSEQQIEASNSKLRPGDFAGKTGLEHQYNDLLQGTDGMRRVVVNSIGKEVERLATQEAIPGKQIQLTIDYDLQQIAEQSLGPRPGAAVALDPRTGEVLAMVSHPALDPNDFAVRISAEDWKNLNEDPQHPLLNRAIQAQLAPGSVFKIVTATAMLEDKVPPENFTTFCPGYATFYGRQFKCWVYGKRSHGLVCLHKAILESCDIFFYNVGMRLGIDRLSYYAGKFGLGHKTGIDLPSEEPGLMPSAEWVERVFHRKWYAGETISVSTGQGAVTTTPLQLVRMISGIAMGGVFKQPHLLKDAPNVGEERFALSEPTVEKITDAMYGVVNEDGGTARNVRLPGIEVSGKSGTAQVIGYATRERMGKQKKFEDNAWFVGYAPRRNPEIAVAVLVQESGKHGGEAAGPVVKDVIKAYYDKKNKKTQGQYTAETKSDAPGKSSTAAAVVAPRAALKPDDSTAVMRARASAEPQR